MKTLSDPYRRHIAEAIRSGSVEISDRWLAKLKNIVNEEIWDIFPTDEYLDHIPLMIDEIGLVIEQAQEELALTNSVIGRKAMQLGKLRHQQKATINQLLREYDLLALLLEEYVDEHTALYQGDLTPRSTVEIVTGISAVVRYILQQTVDSFAEEYISTIENQTEKLISFNKFLSHEIRTPLQSALLNMDLIMENRDPKEAQTLDLVRVQTAIQQAASLIQNIENLIQVENTIADDNPVKQLVDIPGLIRDIDSQLEETLSTRNVELVVANDLGTANVETAKLKLVLTNLITNAIKYSDPEKDKRSITISRRHENSGGEVCLVVEDNGLGIENSMIDEIFDLRVRAHSDKDEKHGVGGHGIGLFLVKEALADLDGHIKVESEIGMGTTITVVFPEG